MVMPDVLSIVLEIEKLTEVPLVKLSAPIAVLIDPTAPTNSI